MESTMDSSFPAHPWKTTRCNVSGKLPTRRERSCRYCSDVGDSLVHPLIRASCGFGKCPRSAHSLSLLDRWILTSH